jgi:hypothetical protein
MGKKIDRSVKGINEALFDMIDRLSDENLKDAALASMIDRSDAIARNVSQINNTIDKAIKVAQLMHAANPKSGKNVRLLLDAVGISDADVIEAK